MGDTTGIAWCDATFNPWVGCFKVGPGCDHCYAEAYDRRYSGGANWGPGAPRRRTTPANWNKVRKWNRDALSSGTRPRVFCASLADVFDNEVDDNWQCDLWELIAECAALDWILVTKRVGNVERLHGHGALPHHVILLATITDQREADRDLPKLLDLKRRGIVSNIGVSYEPALGPVDWTPWLPDHDYAPDLFLDWIIVGGESDQGGAKARPFNVDWAWQTVEQCGVAGVPCFVKQLGSDPLFDGQPFSPPLRDRAGADPSEWPADLRVRQFPVIGGAE